MKHALGSECLELPPTWFADQPRLDGHALGATANLLLLPLRERPKEIKERAPPVPAGVPIKLPPRRWRQSCRFNLVAGSLEAKEDPNDRGKPPPSKDPVVHVRAHASILNLPLVFCLQILMSR